MNPLELAMLARAFRDAGGFTDPEAADVLGVSLSSFCAMKNQRFVGDAFSLAEVERRLRGGTPIVIDLAPDELSLRLRDYRRRHGFSQREAGCALGCNMHTLRGWEAGSAPPRLAIPELLRRLDVPVHVAAIKAAVRKAPLIAPAEFAARLRAWRKQHDLTARMAGEALGIHERTVGAWEACAQFPCARLLRRTLAFLNAPPAGVRSVHGWLARSPKRRDREFGRRLRAWRKAHRMNQLAAAIALGLPRDQALISDYEKAIQYPRPERLAKIEAMIGGAL